MRSIAPFEPIASRLAADPRPRAGVQGHSTPVQRTARLCRWRAVSEEEIILSRRDGILATAGGIMAPVGLTALAFVFLRWTTGAERFEPAMAAASAFFGFVVFDVAVALGMASSRRHGGGAGNYSSLGFLTAFFWFCWLMMTTVPGSDSANWTQSTATALGLGLGDCRVIR